MATARILIVNDSQTQLGIYKKTLEDAGYEVLSAENGREGLLRLRSEMPDLVIADLAMPVMDGFEMIKNIKSDEKTRYIPVICISANYTDLASKLKVLVEIGAEEYFYSPEATEELLAKVTVMLRIRQIYRDLLEKNKALKTFNDAAVGREMKMVELKKRVKQLEQELSAYKK